MTGPQIRCHSCSHALGRIAIPVQLVALFKPSAIGRVGSTRADEIRRRCGSCGWVNVFHPERSTDVVEIKDVNDVNDVNSPNGSRDATR